MKSRLVSWRGQVEHACSAVHNVCLGSPPNCEVALEQQLGGALLVGMRGTTFGQVPNQLYYALIKFTMS